MKDSQEETFIVVDKNDKVVGYRSRYDCHHNRTLTHRAIGIMIFNSKGQLLLQKRSKNKDLNPGKYTLSASGHVDKGETYQQAAERELFEELGIKCSIKEEKRFFADLKDETEMECIFIGNFNGPFEPDPDEIDQIQFVSPKQLPKMAPKLTPFATLSLKEMNLL